ncbi:MAG: putative porin, partial [Armatimonadetes bacterium]|nr:putative porin [Akkermansiaceae bacterium]
MHIVRHILYLLAGLSAANAFAQENPDELVTPLVPAPEVPLTEVLDPSVEIDLPDELPVDPPVAGAIPTAPSQNATVNLIAALVKKGILTQAEAVALIQQAEQDALLAQAQAAAAAAPPIDPAGQRVTYIPEIVRREMRDEIQQELMAQAREENWGGNKAPDWTSRII